MGKIARHLERGLHMAKLVVKISWLPLAARSRNTLGIGAFGHVIDGRGLHLGTQRGLHGFAAIFMLARPAGIQHRVT